MLYKYRGIKDFRYFVDIVLKKRLYAALYSSLNDPMEGHYLYSSGKLDSDIKKLIKNQKEQLRICSLSKVANNELMWAHYAEGHRGVAVGVEVNETKYQVVSIKYDGQLRVGASDIQNFTAQDIFSHKLNVWAYEEEVRVFVGKGRYVDVEVKEILLGQSMSKQDVGFIRGLVKRIDNKIEIKSASRSYA